jgi:hypothetical protein
MIQFQIVIDFREGKNQLIVNVLEREDANDLERELARYLEDLHRTILVEMRDQLPAGEVEYTEIDKPSSHHTPRRAPASGNIEGA